YAGSSSSASVAGVARSSAVWLAEGGPLSTGFTPQGVPHLDACCVPLTPLSTRSSLRERSLMPLKGAPPRLDPQLGGAAVPSRGRGGGAPHEAHPPYTQYAVAWWARGRRRAACLPPPGGSAPSAASRR